MYKIYKQFLPANYVGTVSWIYHKDEIEFRIWHGNMTYTQVNVPLEKVNG